MVHVTGIFACMNSVGGVRTYATPKPKPARAGGRANESVLSRDNNRTGAAIEYPCTEMMLKILVLLPDFGRDAAMATLLADDIGSRRYPRQEQCMSRLSASLLPLLFAVP